jgi:hypothetical protein
VLLLVDGDGLLNASVGMVVVDCSCSCCCCGCDSCEDARGEASRPFGGTAELTDDKRSLLREEEEAETLLPLLVL